MCDIMSGSDQAKLLGRMKIPNTSGKLVNHELAMSFAHHVSQSGPLRKTGISNRQEDHLYKSRLGFRRDVRCRSGMSAYLVVSFLYI